MSEHITSKHNRFARIPFRAVCVVIACAYAAPAPAVNVEARWLAPVSGDWSDPARWSTNPFYPDNGNPAEVEYTALIDAPGPDYEVTFNDEVEVGRVIIRSSAALLSQTGGVLDAFALAAGDVGTGRYRMSDGTLNLRGLAVGGSGWSTSATGEGEFEVVRGQVTLRGEGPSAYVGVGTGTLVVTGPFARYTALPSAPTGLPGTHFIGWGSLGTGVAKLQNRASVTLGGVALGSTHGRGTMLVESGANVFVASLDVARSLSPDHPGGDGTVILGGSSLGVTSQLTVGGLSIGSGGNGTVIVNGGRLTVRDGLLVGPMGTFTVNGGSVTSQSNAFIRSGRFVINGGFVTAPHFHVWLQDVSSPGGTLQLKAGGLTANSITVKNSSNYIQTGGAAEIGFMDLLDIETLPVPPMAHLSGGAFGAHSLLVRNGTFTYAGGSFNSTSLQMTGGRFVATPGRDKTIRAGTLSVSGQGRLDLGDNVMILDDGSPPHVDDIRALVRAGYNNGAWDGPGIMSSVAQTTPGHGIGYVQPSPLFTALLVAYTRYGDADLDGVVDLADFNALAAHFGAGDDWFEGDFNYDGRVDLQDFNRLAAHFGQTAAGPSVTPQDWANLGGAVPEPAAVGLLALTALPLLRQRRRLQP